MRRRLAPVALADEPPPLPVVFGGRGAALAPPRPPRHSRLSRAWRDLMLGAILGFGANPALHAHAEELAQPAPMRVDLPVRLDERTIGDLTIDMAPDGRMRASPGALGDILRNYASEALLNQLETLRLKGPLLSLEEFAQEGVQLTYDAEAVALQVALQAEQRRLQEISVTGRYRASGGAPLEPASTAFGLNLTVQQDWSQSDNGLEGLSGDIDGFLTLGGYEGASLLFSADFEETRAQAWRRGEIALVKDDVERAQRLIAGEFLPRVEGFQTAPGFTGVSLARAYGVLQPGRNIRPAGRSLVDLDRASDVEVIVNDASIARLRLGPGRYDLRDLPYANGLSEVRLAVEDALGRREILLYDGFIGPELLGGGVSDYGVAIGALREGGQDLAASGIAGTGFWRQGVRETLTLGVNAQASEDAAMAGASLAAATAIGIASVEIAAGRGRNQDGEFGELGSAIAVGVNARRDLGPGRQQDIDLRAEYIDRDFRTLGSSNSSRAGVRAAARVRRSYGPLSVSASASYDRDANAGEILRSSIGASRLFERFNLSVRAEYVDDSAARNSEVIVAASLSFRLGERQRLSANYSGATETRSLEWSRLERSGVGDWSARVRARDSDGVRGLSGEASILANRFRAGVAVDVDEVVPTTPIAGAPLEFAGARVRQATRVFAGTAFGYAGGRWAFGREIDRGFLVLTPDASLKERVVRVKDGGRTLAKLDGAPVLATLTRAYQPFALSVDGEDLPDGYDLGDTELQIEPGDHTGYAYHVGSPAITIQLKLRDDAGRPVALRVGYLVDVRGGGGEPIPFFTNRAGRLFAERVMPGTYQLYLQGRNAPAIEIAIPKGVDGYADLGDVVLPFSL